MLNVNKLRRDFPILGRKINGHKLVYLDNAATTQKPKQVIDAIVKYYKSYNSNVHRGIYRIAAEATEAYERAREVVARFIGAKKDEVVFTKNATEGINLVCYSIGLSKLKRGDRILISEMEHHSNFVCWQQIAKIRGARLDFIKMTRGGRLDLFDLKKKLDKRTKILAITHASNVLGTINPVKKIVRLAHKNNTVVLVDVAQTVPQMPINVKELDCDFLVFSSHKMLGPMGVGVLYGKKEILDSMKPFLYGGDMIKWVELDYTQFNDVPYKFEAGTQNVAGAIGFLEAIKYLDRIGMKNVRRHEIELTRYALRKLSKIKGLEIYGPKRADERTGLVSFNLKGIHAHDASQILDRYGICIRGGHHCAMPLAKKLGISSSARASFHIYNTKKEIDLLCRGLEKVKEVFS